MLSKPIIALGADHGGFDLKNEIKAFIETQKNWGVKDYGTYSVESVHYPLLAKKVCQAIQNKEAALGILVCGTGIGISIAANRFRNIRAALVHSEFTAQMAKAHNNANILCLGGRTTSAQEAKKWIQIWLETPFEGGRHQDRLSLIEDI